MEGGASMPKIDIASVPIDGRTYYPQPFDRVVTGRLRRRLRLTRPAI